MSVQNAERLDATLQVSERLAQVLDMYSPTTTPLGLASYVSEQAQLPRIDSDCGADAIRYLVAVAVVLTPPDTDRTMDFPRRAEEAARKATPRDYGTALSTLMQLGWGGARLDDLPPGIVVRDDAEHPTVREVGEQIRALLFKKTAALANTLMTRWEGQGHISRRVL